MGPRKSSCLPLLIAACGAAPEPAPAPAVAEPGVVEAGFDALEHARALDGPNARAAQRQLREAIAIGGPHAVEAALVLINHYALREAFGDALAVADAGLATRPGSRDLGYARALLLRDVDRATEAVTTLERLLSDDPADAEVIALLAELEFSLGRYDAAEVHVESLLGPLASDPFVRERVDQLQRLRMDLQDVRDGRPPRRSAVELLAKLRASQDPALRYAALQALLAAPESRETALAIAALHSDPVVRVAAVRAVRAEDPELERVVDAALADDDERVRAAAAAAVADWELDPGSLERALLAEENGYAFRRLHDAMCRRTGVKIELPIGAEESAEQRRRTLEAWRTVWNQ